MEGLVSKCRQLFNVKICFWHVIVAVVGFIIVYGKLVHAVFKRDLLRTRLFPCEGCDLWALSHTILYFMLGYLFPEHLFILMLMGIVWEVVETGLGTMSDWWFGRTTDIAFNLVGLIGGYVLRQNLGDEVRE